MYHSIQLTKTSQSGNNSLHRSRLRRGLFLFALTLGLACFALSPTVLAVIPPPDGGYPNAITAEGEDALFSLTTGINNTALGFDALFSDTTGFNNTATGANALINNTTGSSNTASGFNALAFNTTASNNTANGSDALLSNTTGASNTASGAAALFSNTTGVFNTATGTNALLSNTGGSSNTANGYEALRTNTTGGQNVANGIDALAANTTGSRNTANGTNALADNTNASDNTANGYDALFSNTTGSLNTADGVNALFFSATGSNNTAHGANALKGNTGGSSNTADGANALLNSSGNNNIALGAGAGVALSSGSNNIDIGNTAGSPGESNAIRIGTRGIHRNSFVAGIFGVTVPTGVGVLIDSNGHLGTTTSSERFKEAIRPMGNASEAILELQPIAFRYKHELDPDGIPQFGLVAEQVEKVNPNLVGRDDQGKPYTVRYEAVNAMLLNEFIKEHHKVEKLEATVARQQKGFASAIAEQAKQIKALTSQIQEMSCHLKVSKPVPRLVVTNQ